MTNPKEWLAINGGLIEQSLGDYAQNHVFYGRRPKNKPTLSDLGLCRSILDGRVALPPGYKPVEVLVSFVKEPKIAGIEHYVGYNGSQLFDYVAGQFLKYHDGIKSISGIAIMLVNAPQLCLPFSQYLCALHATVEEVDNMLGLNYKIK